MKKVLVIIGMILCTLCFVSCASKVKKIEMKMSFDSGTGTEIVDSKDIKEIKKMIMNQEFELLDDDAVPDDYQIWNGERIGITFLNQYNCSIGKTTCYYVSPAGYVSYGHINGDKVEEGYIYISKNNVDYKWLYEKMINNRED